MSKFGFHIGTAPGGLADIFRNTAAANSPIPVVYALDNNIAETRNEYSPETLIVYRDQRFGSDNGAMYQGTPEQAHLAGHAWAAKLIPIWRLNPANYYALINEPGLDTLDAYRWLAAFYMGGMDEAQEAGVKICVGEWATGNPKLDPASIGALVPMLRQAAQNGHILGLHEYAIDADFMIESAFCLRYRRLYEALPADARPRLVISECGPGAGYDTGFKDQPYVDNVGAYDLEIMRDRYVIGFCAFRYGSGESNLQPAMPLIQRWIVDHPTPGELQTTLEERVALLEASDISNRVVHAQLTIEQSELAESLAALATRVTALENAPPNPQLTTVTLQAYPTTIISGQSVGLTWSSMNATSISSNFGAVRLTGALAVAPQETTTYTIMARGANEATASVTVIVNQAAPRIIYQWSGVGVGDNQPLSAPVTSAFEVSRVNAVKLFTMPDADLMHGAINAIKAKRSDTFIMARLFFSVNPGSQFSPQTFVDFCRNGLQAAYAAGVRYFEMHNEPNLEAEGFGFNWKTGAQFGAWLQVVLSILRPLYPLAKWGYPGLSPQPNTVQFFTDSLSAAQACDWIGAHSYFNGVDSTGWGMTSIDGGFHWKRIRDMAQGKPIIITEFSCNTPAIDYASKGRLYRQYYDLLKIEPGVLGAMCYALSWPGSDPNREGWVYQNKVTAIPAAIGAG
jgi:hypothetical protein